MAAFFLDANVIMVPWHCESFPHDVGVIGVTLGGHRTVIVDLVERLEISEQQQRVAIQNVIFRVFLDQGVDEKVEDLRRDVDLELSKTLDEGPQGDDATLGLVTPDKCLLKRIQMLHLNLKCSDTLLYLQLLLFSKLIGAQQLYNFLILQIPIDINSITCT